MKARNISEYRSINLCNFLGKIISKIMLPSLVAEEQAGFVSGMDIALHIVMAHELVRDLIVKALEGMSASN